MFRWSRSKYSPSWFGIRVGQATERPGIRQPGVEHERRLANNLSVGTEADPGSVGIAPHNHINQLRNRLNLAAW